MGPSQWRGPRRGRECLWLGQDARGDPDGPQRRRGDPSGLNSLSARVVLPSRLFLRPEVKPPLVLAFGSRGACLGIRTETPRRSSPRQRSSSERVAHVLPGETGVPAMPPRTCPCCFSHSPACSALDTNSPSVHLQPQSELGGQHHQDISRKRPRTRPAPEGQRVRSAWQVTAQLPTREAALTPLSRMPQWPSAWLPVFAGDKPSSLRGRAASLSPDTFLCLFHWVLFLIFRSPSRGFWHFCSFS